MCPGFNVQINEFYVFYFDPNNFVVHCNVCSCTTGSTIPEIPKRQIDEADAAFRLRLFFCFVSYSCMRLERLSQQLFNNSRNQYTSTSELPHKRLCDIALARDAWCEVGGAYCTRIDKVFVAISARTCVCIPTVVVRSSWVRTFIVSSTRGAPCHDDVGVAKMGIWTD